MTAIKPPWTVLKSGIAPDGAYIELRYAEFGKGRAKVHSWRLYRDGRDAGYASTTQDADTNYRRVTAGYELNRTNGCYEAHPRTIVDNCPICGFDLKGDGYPFAHQADPVGDQCEFILDPDETDEHA